MLYRALLALALIGSTSAVPLPKPEVLKDLGANSNHEGLTTAPIVVKDLNPQWTENRERRHRREQREKQREVRAAKKERRWRYLVKHGGTKDTTELATATAAAQAAAAATAASRAAAAATPAWHH